ncbi:DUF1272 domain-containing protein [Pseudomonas solani]|uniref:DUF1272 domain-containing protein n=1 Tax=Pseudomonas solani TaxID=2731552 RepID=A0AAU7Y8E2_9PSED|nr:DUF1272 domain-containing protein [Pseudomonas sp. zfem005]EQM69921.1 hypothetical protein L682_11495 [Pseudomonas alcaligenes OT 69]MDN4146120.1 DUF1272 domain-containing protein [Pseudomonas tohonis]MDU9413399.1 DUF1272 domain-containing protein [Pseudomonas sp. zfem005]
MLELRPSCEACSRPLPPSSADARICSFECTFCAACAERLENVCPNCGGGFYPRPVRPKVLLNRYPATGVRVEKPVDSRVHADFCSLYRHMEPQHR